MRRTKNLFNSSEPIGSRINSTNVFRVIGIIMRHAATTNRPITKMCKCALIRLGKVGGRFLSGLSRTSTFRLCFSAWLRGTRKSPPTLDETIAQENKRQQLAEKVLLREETHQYFLFTLANSDVTNQLRNCISARRN